MDILESIRNIFNNREIATFFWIVILIIYLNFKSRRKYFKGVLASFFKWKIQAIILFSLFYSCGIIYLLSYINYWDNSMLKDTIFWFLVSAFTILFNLSDISKKKNYFKDIVTEYFKIIIVFEFVVNIHNFSILAEFIFIPAMVLLILLKATSETKHEYNRLNIFINTILSVIGLVLLVLSVLDIINEFDTYASFNTLKSFLLPIILTFSFIPCAYMIALIMNYESLFVRVGFFLPDKRKRRYAKSRIFFKCAFSLKRLNIMSSKINYLYTTATKSEIKEIIN